MKLDRLKLHADFQLIGLSANNVSSHDKWIKDIDNLAPGGAQLDFPIIGDEDRNVSTLYGMLDNLDKTNVDKKGLPFTVRTVFISGSGFTFTSPIASSGRAWRALRHMSEMAESLPPQSSCSPVAMPKHSD